MRILGFDTATRATTVALWDSADPQHAHEARDDPSPGTRPRHTTRLIGLVMEVLERAGSGWAQIDRIAVGLGPGTFTGLRIGIATARALHRARGVPLVGVSTLASLALGARCDAEIPPGVDAVLAVLDARRREVFAAAWSAGRGEMLASGPPLFPPRALSPVALAELIPTLGSRVLALGDGALEFRHVLERPGTCIPEDGSELHRVTAVNHCRLAVRLPPVAPDEIRPEYLRLPDAEIAHRAHDQH